MTTRTLANRARRLAAVARFAWRRETRILAVLPGRAEDGFWSTTVAQTSGLDDFDVACLLAELTARGLVDSRHFPISGAFDAYWTRQAWYLTPAGVAELERRRGL